MSVRRILATLIVSLVVLGAAGEVNPANYITKLGTKANTWSAFGSGLDQAADALAVKGSDIYVRDQFTPAVSKPSLWLARWMGP